MSPSTASKSRLDVLLVARGFFDSRARATAAIKAGRVSVNTQVITRAAHMVGAMAEINISDAEHDYVSRGGIKLAHALDIFGFDPAGICAIDLGASTGGFSDVLLKRDVRHVYAIDVGHDQLHGALRAHPKITSMEGINARALTPDQIGEELDCLVCDVSFISLSLVLPPAISMIRPGGWMVALIKPQFEAGRSAIGKNGVVSDPEIHVRVCQDFATWFGKTYPDWKAKDIIQSPIEGPQGNVEFLFGATNRC
ncbi:MAG: 16S/23S rRNA (cytidine-2'-O)-methyltransferase TlyA [Rhodobiaceae bacterium UBA7378]|nr:MAG: 16S/23S rRNA (cytidine-2'-O)-methyltransferase TlyA [Rhodobiaceae bacterium UBA7378]